MTQNAFEIPQQMRDLAESNIEQARTAYDQFMSAMNQALALWSKSMPSNPMLANFAALQNQATAFAKQNAEAAFALANDLAKAKDFQEIIALQSRFAHAQMQAFASQARESGQLVAEAMQK